MKLWLISQEQNDAYDTFDSAVVAAETEELARHMHPNGTAWDADDKTWKDPYSRNEWAQDIDCVGVRLIGEAVEGTEAGVVLASFNAG